MRKKTIAVVAPYFPPHTGGLERYAREIAMCLSKSYDWRVVVITSGEKGIVDTCEEIDGLTIYRLGYAYLVSNTPFSFKWFRSVREIYRKEKPDVVHIHMPVPGLPDVAALLSSVPTVITYHAASMKKGRWLVDVLIRVYENLWLPLLLRRADKVIVSASTTAAFLGSVVDETITPAVSLEEFTPGESVGGKRILFVASDLSRACEYKGLSTVLDALSVVRMEYPDVSLAVVGDGDLRAAYEKRAHASDITTHFYGRLSGPELAKRYREADIFVLPTENDTHPMVILEAMASGLPVIATSIGNIPNMVVSGTNGFLIEPKNVGALVSSLKNILDNPALAKRFSEASLARVESAYQWGSRVDRYDAIFRALLARPIAQVIAYYPPRVGGMERVASLYAHTLHARGHDVRVITSRRIGERVVADSLPVCRLFGVDVAHTSLAPMLLWHLLRLPKRTILHLHFAQGYWSEMVMLASWLRGFPYIAHFHLDVAPSGYLGFLFPLYKKFTWGPFMRNATQVLVCSEAQIPIVERYGVARERIVYVPNAVNELFFAKRSYEPSSDVFRLIYVGRLADQKKLDRLLAMMQLIKIPALLTIVGDGDERTMLESFAMTHHLSSVCFVGAQPPERVRELLSMHDAFVISSEQEGAPLAVIEAMATATPVIGTDVIGIHELVEHVGVLVSEPYAENLASIIEHLWHNPTQLFALSHASLEKAAPFRTERVIDLLEECYRNI